MMFQKYTHVYVNMILTSANSWEFSWIWLQTIVSETKIPMYFSSEKVMPQLKQKYMDLSGIPITHCPTFQGKLPYDHDAIYNTIQINFIWCKPVQLLLSYSFHKLWMDGRMDEQMNRQRQFHRSLFSLQKVYRTKILQSSSRRERERLTLSAFLRTEDIGVHIVHISHLIMTYTLE